MDYKIPEPRLPTFNDVKQGLAGLYDAVRNPPDPSQTAGNIINAARQGDYAGALEQGLTMPGVGMFVKPYDMARLKEAHNMRALRATPDEIWRKTQTGDLGAGMVQELDDRAMTINPAAVPRQPSAPALGVMRHPTLFQTAPEAVDMPVRQGPNPGFDYTSQRLTLDPRTSAQHQRIEALGGLQQYIAEQNGWPVGGGAQMLKGDPEFARIMPESYFEAQANRLNGNQLAKATQRRADMTPEQRAARFPERDMDMPLNQQIIQRFK